MKNYLKEDSINIQMYSDVAKNSHELVNAIYGYDKSQPYQNFYYIAVIRTSHLKNYGDNFVLLTRNAADKLRKDSHPCNMSLIPEQMLTQSLKRNRTFVHVLAQKRIYYYDHQETRLIIRANQKQLGYFSNSAVPNKKALSFLKDVFYEREPFSLRKKMLLKLHMFANQLQNVAKVFHLPLIHAKAA